MSLLWILGGVVATAIAIVLIIALAFLIIEALYKIFGVSTTGNIVDAIYGPDGDETCYRGTYVFCDRDGGEYEIAFKNSFHWLTSDQAQLGREQYQKGAEIPVKYISWWPTVNRASHPF